MTIAPVFAAAMLGAAVLGGCAALAGKTEPPQVSLAGLQIVEMGLFEQRFNLKLRIQNPNDFSLPIRGMTYDLELNEQQFARGVSNQSVTVPALGEGLVDVQVVSNLFNVLEQLRSLSGGQFSYRLSGGVSLAHRAARIPFEYQGQISLTGNRDGAKRGIAI